MSTGCQHCYAEAFAKRTGQAEWGKTTERRFFGEKHWAEPLKWDRQAKLLGERRRVFCASMADVFEDRDDLREARARLFDLITFETPNLDWQLLTKRPENVLQMVPPRWLDRHAYYGTDGWPANCWIGTTVEDQERALERVPKLLEIPAPVRFLSCEPLLDEVRLARWLWTVGADQDPVRSGAIDWVIVGGESGPKHRPMDMRHARILHRECFNAGVSFFFKQVGGRTPTAGGDLLDGRTFKQFPKPKERNE